jgi:hypothetical protein
MLVLVFQPIGIRATFKILF